MLQNIGIFGTLAAAAVCLVYAIYTYANSEEQAQPPHRPPQPQNRDERVGPVRQRSTALYERRRAVLDSIQNRTIKCAICYELIRNYERAWFCRFCSIGFHLTCAKHWSDERTSQGENYSCPSCRHIAHSPINMCMCGRSNSPNSNYSCSSTCQLCDMICHPGPCILEQ